MLFSNISFIFIFLPVTVLVYLLASPKKKNTVLLTASLVFYAWGEPIYVVLLLLSAMFNYFCGQDIEDRRDNPVRAKKSLAFAIVINLLILGFFKYYALLMESVNAVSPAEIPYREFALPAGISFYMLRVLSYLIDIYRGEAGAQKRFFSFALYLTMFPTLPAGPVERYAELNVQLEKRMVSPQRFGNGAMLFVCGLAKKVVLADSLGIFQEQITGMQIGTFSMLTAWIGCAAFAFRLYFELSGFADMAAGLGRMFGFEFRRNFNYPYISRSVTEFWKRWNISVASWFHIYVYEPLGGDRTDSFRQMWNLLLLGILTGFWYGARWQFLWWGIYFGVLLSAERFVWGKLLVRLPKAVQHIYAVIVIFIGWAWFFSPDLGLALDYIGVMFGVGASGIADTQTLYFLISHWLLLVFCIVGSSSRGTAVLHSIIEVPQSVQGKKIAACVVYMIIFIVSLAFLVTGTGESGLTIQF